MNQFSLKIILEFLSNVKYLISAIFLYYFLHNFLKDKIRRQTDIIIPIVYFIYCIIFFWMYPSTDNILMDLLGIILAFAIISIVYDTNVPIKVFLIATFYAIKELCLLTSYSIFYFLQKNSFKLISVDYLQNHPLLIKHYPVLMEYIQIIIGIIFLLIFFILMYTSIVYITKKFIYKNYDFNTKETLFLIMPALSAQLISFMIFKIILTTFNNNSKDFLYDKYPSFIFLIPAIGIVSLMGIAGTTILFQNMISLNEEKRNKIILEHQVYDLQNYTNQIQQMYNGIRGIKHDMRNHINNLKWLVTEGKYNEMEKYFNDISNTVNKLDFKFGTGNSVTDVIINDFYRKALKNNILFESDFTFPSSFRLDVFDISIILSNILENALDACKKQSLESKPFIIITSSKKKNLFFIDVKNSFESQIKFDNTTKLPVSSKSDKSIHGIGLKNVQTVARKYFGDIDIEIENKVFNLTVMLKKL
ncbi:sensor histidine kinase [Clostridium autoethanogenum]|nr:ATP-binding protein [Clostridium autoethanogenum]ALU38066.1 putative sensor histidine kinase [Clostridium autoethanogenum DSM 10061]OVY50830.1 hypothetical protein WX72_01991 [Clostridium autoethanogenum]